MKKLGFLVVLSMILGSLVFLQPTQAQDDASVDAAGIVDFRPLGRFTLYGNSITISPNGLYAAGTTSYTREVAATEDTPSAAEDDTTAESTDAGSDEDTEPETITITRLHMWDMRGGQHLWQVELPENRTLESLVFAPSSDVLYVRTNRPYPAEEEVRLSFYNTVSGRLISQTGDVDVIQSAIVSGDLAQDLSIEPFFTPDGQRIIINYQRRLEEGRCAAWDIASGTIIWQATMHCSSINPDGRFLTVYEPHANPYSSYPQIAIYEVATGDIVAVSEDEIVEARWLDATHVMIQRPYGDPPVIWDVVSNTRAILETPFRALRFWVRILPGDMLTHTEQGTTYVWDQSSGRLLNEVPIWGSYLLQDNRILLLQMDSNYYDYTFEDDEWNNLIRAYDFETGNQIWGAHWQHELRAVSPDATVGVGYDRVTYLLDTFDLNSGEQLGSLQINDDSFYITDDWQWIIEPLYGYYVVWGDASELGRFDDQPGAVTRDVVAGYYDPNTNYDPATELAENTYVWLVERTADDSWLLVETARRNRYWVPANEVDILIDLETIAVRE